MQQDTDGFTLVTTNTTIPNAINVPVHNPFMIMLDNNEDGATGAGQEGVRLSKQSLMAVVVRMCA